MYFGIFQKFQKLKNKLLKFQKKKKNFNYKNSGKDVNNLEPN